MRKLCTLVLCFLMAVSQLLAQTNTVTGKVTDAKTSTPIVGATVKVKGKSTVAITGDNGTFKISVTPSDKILEISSVGFNTIQVKINNSSIIAQLTEVSNDLSEVVVVGYGTKIKKDVTGSIATVTAKEITNTPATSLESAIQGRAAGVQVSQQNGKLGQGINIRIRGTSSVSAGNEPLYVIDGIPVTTDNLSSNGASTNALADFNMNDIESIQILKDASSTAIYGTSASNGVVLITTKKGKLGTSKIDFSMFKGNQTPTGKREFLNAEQYVNYFTQAAAGAANQDFLAGYFGSLASANAFYTAFVNNRFRRYSGGNNDWQTAKVNTDWQSLAFQDAPIAQYDLNFSGASEKTKFYLSGQVLDQTGIIVRNSLTRYSTRLSAEHQMKDWLTVGVNLSFARTYNYRVSNDNAFSTPLQIVALSPITPTIDPRTGFTSGALDLATGNPNTNFPVYYNPILSVQNASYNTFVNRTFGTTYANIYFSKYLTFRTEFGLDQLNQVEETYNGKLTSRNTGVPNGSGNYLTSQVLNYTTNNYFTYKNTFGTKHSLTAVLGTAFTSRKSDFSSASGEQFPSDAYKKLANAASKTDASSSSTSSAVLSYFSRVDYKYNNRYLFTATARIDGSSRLGTEKRYAGFYGVSAGWIISEEAFFGKIKWINTLKLKAGYAGNGNDRINDFGARGLYSGNASYGGLAGQHPTQLANPFLKWEATYGADLGFDAALFNNRITVEFDYYSKKTKDLLLSRNVPSSSGFSTQLQNIGTLENKGFEITVNTVNIRSKNFTWSSSFNISTNENKVTYLAGQLIGTGVNKAKEGEPLGVFYTREFAGADPANGDALFYKNTVKADGSIDRSTTNDYNAAQDVRIGSPIPKFIYGFGNSLSYKGADLDFLFQGVSGNDVYNDGGQYMSASGSNGFDNQTTDQLAAWKKPGDITMVPEARLFYANGVDPSSRFISKGSYLRLKALTLGYNVTAQFLKKAKIERVRVYLRAQNLLTITKYKGWDPEVNADYQANNINQGIDFYSAPQLKTIVFGVNIVL